MPARTQRAARNDLKLSIGLGIRLANHDLGFTSRIDRVHGCLVGAALVHNDFLWNTIGLHGLVKEAQGCGLVTPGAQQSQPSGLPCPRPGSGSAKRL